jgi:hypothetical protein
MNNSDDGGNNKYGADANKDDDVMSGVEQPIEENEIVMTEIQTEIGQSDDNTSNVTSTK